MIGLGGSGTWRSRSATTALECPRWASPAHSLKKKRRRPPLFGPIIHATDSEAATFRKIKDGILRSDPQRTVIRIRTQLESISPIFSSSGWGAGSLRRPGEGTSGPCLFPHRMKRRSLASALSSMAKHPPRQEMLDFCGKHSHHPGDPNSSPSKKINDALRTNLVPFRRAAHRFVIDTASRFRVKDIFKGSSLSSSRKEEVAGLR